MLAHGGTTRNGCLGWGEGMEVTVAQMGYLSL